MTEEFVIVDNIDKNGNVETKTVSVWDLVNPMEPRADKQTRIARLDICHGCDHLKFPEQCDICECLMRGKTWLLNAQCPIGKW